MRPVVHREDGSEHTVVRATCLDFVYFRQMIREARRPDDNINHRLNKIAVQDRAQCQRLWDEMQGRHRERRQALEFCISSLEQERAKLRPDDKGSFSMLSKEVHGRPSSWLTL